ncbi:MAG TPA: FtsX-like permease family protein, partial [Acidobacteriota bacterium]|nr:FtsX-like permease family protein [Acidobacteriota bacterium]
VLAMGNMDLGIRTDRLLTMRIPLNPQRYPDAARRIEFLQELLDRLPAVPGVEAAGLNTGMHPLGNWNTAVEVVGSARQDQRPVLVHQVSEDYIRTVGIPLLQGRLFTRIEITGKQHFALVNQSFLRRFLADGQPLGRILRLPQLRSAPFNATDDSFQVVGVVQDTTNRILANEVSPEVYIPFTITGIADRLVVLTKTDPATFANAVRLQIYATDPEQPATEVRTMEAIFNEWVFAEPRFNLVLFSVFAGLGLVLAIVGVYGVISNSVSQQTQEIGVRIALGADFRDIVKMVVTTGLKLLGAGIALGLVAGLAAARILREQIWNVSPFDPLSFSLVAVVLALAGIQACIWPALRAARTDPVVALRLE